MRQLVYHVSTTLDNYICHEDGSIDGFIAEGDHVTEYLDSLANEYDTVLMGKATYEFGYRYGLKPGQRAYPHMKHYIFSRTLRFSGEADPRLVIVRNNEKELIDKIKNEEGKNIYLCGGGVFAGSLLQEQLIDKLIIKLHPVLFGKGIRLFHGSEQPATLELENFKTYDNGVVLLTYKLGY